MILYFKQEHKLIQETTMLVNKINMNSKHFRARMDPGLHLLLLPHFTKIPKSWDLSKITKQLSTEEE